MFTISELSLRWNIFTLWSKYANTQTGMGMCVPVCLVVSVNTIFPISVNINNISINYNGNYFNVRDITELSTNVTDLLSTIIWAVVKFNGNL